MYLSLFLILLMFRWTIDIEPACAELFCGTGPGLVSTSPDINTSISMIEAHLKFTKLMKTKFRTWFVFHLEYMYIKPMHLRISLISLVLKQYDLHTPQRPLWKRPIVARQAAISLPIREQGNTWMYYLRPLTNATKHPIATVLGPHV